MQMAAPPLSYVAYQVSCVEDMYPPPHIQTEDTHVLYQVSCVEDGQGARARQSPRLERRARQRERERERERESSFRKKELCPITGFSSADARSAAGMPRAAAAAMWVSKWALMCACLLSCLSFLRSFCACTGGGDVA
jgi:hypothetical protein